MSISDNQLASNVIGLREVVCQSICSMAPGAAIAASILFGSPLAGGALPLVVVFGFIGILFTASSIGQLPNISLLLVLLLPILQMAFAHGWVISSDGLTPPSKS